MLRDRRSGAQPVARARRSRRGSGGAGADGPPSGRVGEAAEGQRRRRVAEELRHRLSDILRHGACRDPALREVSITVSEIRLSADLRNATAYVMPLGGANIGEIMAGLRRSAGFLRGLVARDATLRYAPNLTFALDETFDQADRIAALLARPEVERDLHPPADDNATGDNGG